MAISSSSSEWTWAKADPSPIGSLIQSMFVSISEITASVECINIEQETFLELGSYLYRANSVLMELQTTENTPEDAIGIIRSLSRSVDMAKNFVGSCQKGSHSISDLELRSIVEQLEGLIKHMGEELSLIPPSTFGDQDYAGIAVQSVAKEMQNARFGVFQTPVTRSKALHPRVSSMDEKPDEQPMLVERDLYSIDFSTDNPQLPDIPPHVEHIPKTKSYRSKRNNEMMKNGSLMNMPPVNQYMESLYETFFCPLTKNIMEDPVTIESGVTYERKAITEWLESCSNSAQLCCPLTGQKLQSKDLSTNIALKTIIEEWKERNEAARIKVARAALSLASSESMVLEALNDLQSICRRKPYNKVQIRNVGMLPLLVKLLEYKDRNVRCAALDILRELAEDDEGKDMVAKGMDISTIIKMLSSNHQTIRHASLLFLLELSRSQCLCEKIGLVAGGILMLVTIKYNHSSDVFALEKVDEILKNLEISPNNIKRMAENGYLEPLLHHLVEGCEEMKMEMGSYLGEIALGHENKTYVAERASPALVKMLHTGNTVTEKAAFKALEELSSYHPNGKILVQAGIVQIMVEEIFTRKIYNEPMNSRKEAAAILGNLLESGIEFENLQVNNHGHTMGSDYIVYSIIHMLKNSTPEELVTNLIRILLCLARSPKSTATIVSVVRETEASYTLLELINSQHEELGIASMKLLITLSPYLGHTIAERLCKTRGQPENLIQSPAGTYQITEKQAVSVNFLADLPHQNLTLNLALLSNDTIPIILQSIHQIQRSGARTSRYASAYLEGLVGIIVRFTSTLYEPQMLFLARNYNFTSVLTELLTKTSSDKVQRLSAIGLKNLSSESANLSKPPQKKGTKFMKFLSSPRSLSIGPPKKKKIQVCPVHRGACSSQNTFCLLEAKAVERLLACLQHENAEVVEAALSAICTLLDEKVDVDKSVSLLSGVDCIQHVLNAVKEHREEGLREKSLWVIERFLMKGGDRSASYISQDRLLPATLISAFHHGDDSTKQMAEKILIHLNRMPKVTTNFTF